MDATSEQGDSQITNDTPVTQQKPIPTGPVQSVIPVKQIYKGMIVTTDDRYVKIIEVLPINFSLRSTEEQDNIIHLFASWLRIAPMKLQFKIVTRRADTFQIINNVKAATEAEPNQKCRELADNYISFIRELSGYEALTRRFFLIIEYEPTNSKQRTVDEIADEMENAFLKVKAGLNSCGNDVVIPPNEDYFQAEILYLFYNRRSCITEQLADRVIRVTNDTMKVNGLVEGEDDYPDIPVSDYIAPRGLDFTHSDYFICDGAYQSILMIVKDGYPSAVCGGWMSTLIETGDGVDIDIILRQENRAYAKDKVALNLKLHRIKASNRSDVDTDYEEIEGAIESAQYIKSCLAGGEDFYHMYTFITVSADTLENLEKQKEMVTDYLYSQDIIAKEIHLRLEDAFQVVTPVLQYRQELMQMASRNVMTEGAASLYPFTSCEICDENGIVLGVNRRYSSLVNLDIFNTRKYKNANIAIIGTTGSGKTYTELTMALRMRIQGIQTFIISPDKSHEFRRACGHIDGSYIRISPGSQNCINIMEIRPIVNPVAEFLDEYDPAEADSWLAQKTSQLLTFFHLLIPDLSNEEEQLVDESIIKTYNLFEITHDNESLYLAGSRKMKPMPIIGDLYDTLKQNEDTKRVANILGRFVTGSAQSFNQQTNVDLENKFIVFDLSDLTDTLKAVGMFIVMDFLWTRIKANRTEKKAIFIDEGWQLIGASADSRAADFVYRIFKIIRGYGGSAIFATQDISDLFAFMDGKYGKAIISNSKIKIVLGLEQQEAKCVQDVLQLTQNEVRSITNFARGEGLICVNNNKVPVFIRASKLEDELITTDPQQLLEIVNRKKMQQAMRSHLQHDTAPQPAASKANPSPASPTVVPPKEAAHATTPKPIPNTVAPPTQSTMPAPAYIPPPAPPTPVIPSPVTPTPPAEPLPREQVISEQARMSILAMEQLANGEVIRNPDGSRDTFQDDTVMVGTDRDEDFADDMEVCLGFVNPKANIQNERSQVPLKPEADDDDLSVADDLYTPENVPPIDKTKGVQHHGNHPPAWF